MLRQKFKRIINSVLAAVMLAGTFSAVSYVQPVNVYAANGDQEWYNPALRWKETKNYREHILIANSIVSEENAHCQNAECPSNRIDGFRAFVGGYTFYAVKAVRDGDDYRENRWDDDECIGNILTYTFEKYGITYYWANEYNKQGKLPDGTIVTSELVDDEGKWVGGGNNTGTHTSMVMTTVFRVPEYTASGVSYAEDGAVKYGYSSPVSKEKYPTREAAAAYFGVSADDVIYLERGVLKTDSDGNATEWGEGWAAIGYIKQYYDERGRLCEALIPDWKVVSPRKGGRYTGYHFTASYCNSCGLWGTVDNDDANTQINNCSFMLNECKIVYKNDTGVGEGEDTSIEHQTGLECEVSRTYAAESYNADNQYHKVLDATLPMCLYCFGTPAVEKEEQYHYHKHKERITAVDVISPNAIAVTKQCLEDSSVGRHPPIGDDENCSTYNMYKGKQSVVTRDAEDPIGISGCGYEETDYYTGLKTVQDYIGVVDGKTHYVSFNGEEVMDDIVNYSGSTKDMDLRAKLTWDEGEPPHKMTSGTAVGHYTITYTLPNAVRYDIEDEAEATEANPVSTSFINGEDANKQIVYKGTATVTLVPQNYENEDSTLNPNYTNNGWSMTNQLLGNLYVPSTGSTSVSMSGSGLGVASGDFATYDAYEPTWDEDLGKWVIETGQCNNLGDTHRYVKTGRETEDGTIYDIWECVVCHSRIYIVVGVDAVVHVHHYYKYDEIPATCNSKGVIFRRCVCGAMETEDTAINGGNHVGTTHKVDPAPTCEDAGYEYDECVGCGAKLNGHSLEKLGHQWSVSSMMDGKGHSSSYVIQECERCHKLQTISSNGTVTSGGITSGSDVSLSDSTPHNYVYQYTETEGDNSYEIWQCDICGDIDRRLVEANGHTSYRCI